jgi:hypothetical protein
MHLNKNILLLVNKLSNFLFVISLVIMLVTTVSDTTLGGRKVERFRIPVVGANVFFDQSVFGKESLVESCP